MPIYEYRCTNEHRFEVMQRFTDDPLTDCQVCGAPAQRVLYPAAIHFKGSGFYSTDYGRGKKKGDAKADGGEAKSSSDGSGSGGSSSSDSKPEPKKAAEA
jgi:putative FmdB family regulatory protein